MKKELIRDILAEEFAGAFDNAAYESQLTINKVLNIAYQDIRQRLSDEYHNVMNRPQEVGVKEFSEHLVTELHKKASMLSHERLYKSGYYDAIKVIENIIKSHGKDL